jgi:hypothetical protein
MILYGGAPSVERVGSGEGANRLPRKNSLIFNIKTVAFWWLQGDECFFRELNVFSVNELE